MPDLNPEKRGGFLGTPKVSANALM
jgi:hypothetical protein